MIESEEKRKRLKEIIGRWCKHAKIKSYLRDYDVPSLVEQILEEFYHVRLCCSHLVISIEDGISLAFKENDGSTVQGIYCKECAGKYKKELGAWEINEEQK